MESAGSAVKDLGGYLLSTFIDLWNALVPAVEATLIAFQPLINIRSWCY
jgi:hypothetical protein